MNKRSMLRVFTITEKLVNPYFAKRVSTKPDCVALPSWLTDIQPALYL